MHDGPSDASGRDSAASWGGHAVLQVGVPALESWSLGRARHYDAAFVSADPGFSHAHVTVLAPLNRWDLAAIAAIAASTAPFRFKLSRQAVFPNGIVYLHPEPDDAFRGLTAAAMSTHPWVEPFGGPNPTPHLTLDALGDGVSAASTRAAVAPLLPARCLASQLELVWYEANNCHLIRRWPFTG